MIVKPLDCADTTKDTVKTDCFHCFQDGLFSLFLRIVLDQNLDTDRKCPPYPSNVKLVTVQHTLRMCQSVSSETCHKNSQQSQTTHAFVL